jgi:hypothetical protein
MWDAGAQQRNIELLRTMVSGHDGLRGVGDRGQKCPEKGPCYTELNPG